MDCLIKAIKYDDMGISRGLRWFSYDLYKLSEGIRVHEGTFEEFNTWAAKQENLVISGRSWGGEYDYQSWLTFVQNYTQFSQILANGEVMHSCADKLSLPFRHGDYYVDFEGRLYKNWKDVPEAERFLKGMHEANDLVTESGRKKLETIRANLLFAGWYCDDSSNWIPPDVDTVIVPMYARSIVLEDRASVKQLACDKYLDSVRVVNSNIECFKSPDVCSNFWLDSCYALQELILPKRVCCNTVSGVSNAFMCRLSTAPMNLTEIDQSNYGALAMNMLSIHCPNVLERVVLAAPLTATLNVANLKSIDIVSAKDNKGSAVDLNLFRIPELFEINLVGTYSHLSIKCGESGASCIRINSAGDIKVLALHSRACKSQQTFMVDKNKVGSIKLHDGVSLV